MSHNKKAFIVDTKSVYCLYIGYMYIKICICEYTCMRMYTCIKKARRKPHGVGYNVYGVASVSRIDKIIGLFCKRAL